LRFISTAKIAVFLGYASSFSPATGAKRRCRGALQNCGASAWYSADRASVVECGARAPLCRGPAEGAAPLPGNRFAVQSRWQWSLSCLRFV